MRPITGFIPFNYSFPKIETSKKSEISKALNKAKPQINKEKIKNMNKK